MRKAEYHVDDLSEGFALCRELDRPIVVTCSPQPDMPGATQFKLYPSGRILWAYDGDNPFQAELPSEPYEGESNDRAK